ncbi:hypothetical protein DENSPDRAFT_127578 [Dentipellis sp. KUC8613]|nr:hypothetical protein DENSPDRAFT_127578 [Dentipellis sp. KUC8613]
MTELYSHDTFFAIRQRIILLLAQGALGDSIIIWRCYIVYGQSVVVVILPALAALASFALGLSIACRPSFALHGKIWTWMTNGWIWAAMTVICTIYCTFAMSLKIYSSARLTKSSNLFAVIFFIVETGLIYTVSVAIYAAKVRNLGPKMVVMDTLMGVVVHIPPIVLCLLLLQIKFYNSGSEAVQYTNTEPVRPWDVMRRIFRMGGEESADYELSTFRVASVAMHDSTHARSLPAECPSPVINDTLGIDEPRSPTIGQVEKGLSGDLGTA